MSAHVSKCVSGQIATHVLELRNIRARYIHQRLVIIDDTFSDERPHAEMVVLHAKVLKIALGEDQSSEVLINRLKQRLGRHSAGARSIGVLDAAVAVDSDIVSDAGLSCAAEGFDGEDVAFLHALIGMRFHERYLLVAVDFVAENVMACEAADRFHRDSLAFQLDFVALHCLLNHLADAVDTSIDPSFLYKMLAYKQV